MAIDEVLAVSMSTWAADWEQKMGYNAEQAVIFMDEWKYVLAAPSLAMYRKSSTGIEQLNKLACKMYANDCLQQLALRGQWAYDTLFLVPDSSVCEIAFMAWSEATPYVRQAFNPEWAQWYDLFSDSESFLQCVRQAGMLCEEMLPLPDAMHSESLSSP